MYDHQLFREYATVLGSILTRLWRDEGGSERADLRATVDMYMHKRHSVTLPYPIRLPTLPYPIRLPTLPYLTRLPTLSYPTRPDFLPYPARLPTLPYPTSYPLIVLLDANYNATGLINKSTY